MRKLTDYAAKGIAQIWGIDPEGPSVQAGHLAPATRFEEPGRGMVFEMSEIEALVDWGRAICRRARAS